jgi:quercetin dioxygenase-like cupin family protein
MGEGTGSAADELRNPFTGQTLRFLSEDDEVLVMESSYEPGSPPAPAHLHPAQEERFTVLAGAVRAALEGEERILEEGDVLVVPAATAHDFGGVPDRGGTVRWEVRPPLRTREFFVGLFGALNAAAAGEEAGSTGFDFADYEDVFRPD